MDLLVPRNLITLHAMDLSSRFSMQVLVSSGNVLEVWGASAASWIAVFGKPSCLRIGSGGGWGAGVWADPCSERNVRPQF